jgi:hypothetical protein
VKLRRLLVPGGGAVAFALATAGAVAMVTTAVPGTAQAAVLTRTQTAQEKTQCLLTVKQPREVSGFVESLASVSCSKEGDHGKSVPARVPEIFLAVELYRNGLPYTVTSITRHGADSASRRADTRCVDRHKQDSFQTRATVRIEIEVNGQFQEVVPRSKTVHLSC